MSHRPNGQRRVCSVSVDLDPIACYYRIHALGDCPDELGDVILRRTASRFLELFARHNVRATFFIVGSDLDGDNQTAQAARATIKQIFDAGHEIANHSHGHPYEMARLSRERVAEEIGRAHDLLADVTGRAPVGFRAPGYDISSTMLDELSRLGYRYDSSVFPAPGYYAAKAAVMAVHAAYGRSSGAVLTNPRALLAPAEPYRPHVRAPWRRGQSSLVELPVAVTPWLRVPVIGTNLVLAPAMLRVYLLDAMRTRSFFNFELHGIDLTGAEEDSIPTALVQRQRDLRVSLADKRRRLEATLDRLKLDYQFLPLADVATAVQRDGRVG